MALSNKELEYFKGELPEGMKVVDLTGVSNRKEFVEKFCPDSFYKFDEMPYSMKMVKAIENFLKLNK